MLRSRVFVRAFNALIRETCRYFVCMSVHNFQHKEQPVIANEEWYILLYYFIL